MTPVVLVATLFFAGAPPPEPPATPAAVVATPAAPSFLDQAQAAHAAKAGHAGVANALVPGSVVGEKAAGVDVDRLMMDAEVQLAPPLRADGKPTHKPDPKKAIALFQRALAGDPARAAPLWGLSRAHDAAGEKALARHYAVLVVRSKAADKTQEMASAAMWRLEMPQ
jgi:hypothetical protein